MEANQILRTDLLEIIFQDRNKAYGAYELRKTYNRRLRIAMITTASFCLLFISSLLFASRDKENANAFTVPDPVVVNLLPEEKKPIVVEKLKIKAVQVQTIKAVTPRIVRDNEVDKSEVPVTDSLENLKIADITQEGIKDDGIVSPPLEKTGTGEIDLLGKEPNYGGVFTSVQIQARFPGGADAWRKFLERNLNSTLPIENGAPAGSYTVVVSFLVDAEGNISEVQALNNPGYGTAEEAVRVIKKSQRWIPAEQNGHSVIYRQKQAITFMVSE